MTATVIAFFNNKGGVGKTSLVYHLAWMFADHGVRVVAADLDPQANLTAAFLDEEDLEPLWSDDGARPTVYGAIRPLVQGIGDVKPAHVEEVDEAIGLVVGDLALSGFEDELSSQWPGCLDGKERAFRVISAFWRVISGAADRHGSTLVLVDVGPNLGAINRAALVAADHVVIPLSPDLFSLQGLRNLGPTLRRWRGEWSERLPKNPEPQLGLPAGRMQPAGYVVLQHGIRLDRPVQAYDRWIRRIPQVYARSVLDEPAASSPVSVVDDPNCLALLKHYHSLVPMGQEQRKPIFHLKPADGALGAHQQAVHRAYGDFRELADAITHRVGLAPLSVAVP